MTRAVSAAIRRARRSLGDLERGEGPVLAGPFTGEVGFELLYWIPFLRWALLVSPKLAGRVVVMSRGGAQGWYDGVADRYVDILDLVSAEELRHRRGSLKQARTTEFEAELVKTASTRLGSSARVLHPALLFGIYTAARRSDPWAFVRALTADGTGLAASYAAPSPPPNSSDHVAVRLYHRPSLPDTEANRAFADRLLRLLQRSGPVLSLDPGVEIDDHAELTYSRAGLQQLPSALTPANNLAIQSEAIRRSRFFVGTYGGLAYVGPMTGVPAFAFSSHPEHVHPWHQALVNGLAAVAGWAPLTHARPAHAESLLARA